MHSYNVGDQPLPGYRLEEFLGRGGFGEVWRASGPGGTSVALKIIKDLSSVQGRKELRSLRIVKRIQHAHIVPITGVWLKDETGALLDDSLAERDDLFAARPDVDATTETLVVDPLARVSAQLFIAMGLGHKSLFDVLQECRNKGLPGIPSEELLDYMDQAARAIDYLNSASHQLGSGVVSVQHCDIKPHNILLVGTAVQVCDFGLARVRDEIRATSSSAGSAAYAAPECLAEGGRPSGATDQYSLAITYYELRAGSLPYHDESLFEVMRAVLNGDLDLAKVSEAERVVLRHATQINPEARFASCREMIKALRLAVEQPHSTLAETAHWSGQNPSRPGTQETSRGGRKRVGLLLAIILLGGLGWWGFRQMPHAVGPLPEQDTSDATAAAELTHAAEAAATRGDYERAIVEYGKALDRVPHFAPAFAGRGECYLQDKAFDRAIADFEAARESDPKNYGSQRAEAQAHFDRGSVRLKANEFDAALDDFAAAGQLNPDEFSDNAEIAAAYVGRGLALLQKGDPEHALKSFDAAIVEQPKRAQLAYLPRGQSRLALGDSDGAIVDFNQALEFDTGNAAALWSRGEAYAGNKDYAHAIADLERASKLDAKLLEDSAGRKALADSYYRRGLAAYGGEKLEEAVADYELARHLDATGALGYQNRPEYVEAYLKHGAALRDQKQFAAAAVVLKTATELDPKNALAFSRLGYVQLKQRQYADAIRSLSLAIQFDPNDLDVFNRAIAYSAEGDSDTALREFDALLERTPDDPDTHYQRALAYLDKSRYTAAIADLRETVRLAPENSDAAAQLALVLAGEPGATEENGKEALQLAQQACLASNWKSAGHLDALAAACASTGKMPDAVKWARKAVELATEAEDADPEATADFKARLQLYERGEPFHFAPAP